MQKLSNRHLAQLGLRLMLGTNIALHGATRVADPAGFASGIQALFTDTLLPAAAAYTFAWVLPFFELALGLALLAGLYLRQTLFTGLLLMALLSAGTCLRQAWETASVQLVYGLAYWALLWSLQEQTEGKTSDKAP